MHKLKVAAAVLLVPGVLLAQPRSAIQTARNTASTAEARNAAIGDQQAQATGQTQGGQATGQPGASSGQTGADSGSAPAARAAAQLDVPAIMREVYAYDGGGRRDPFVSLARSAALRPVVADLTLTLVITDNSGRSVAILRDRETNDQYRVTVGSTIGRMRVIAIDNKKVTFQIEEFGYSRQQSLALGDTAKVRNQ